jgi:hypothetical protein
LQRIAEHTKSADMSLREMTFGGGALGGRALSSIEMYGRSIFAPATNATSDLEKGITKIIRTYNSNNNLNLNFRRS